MCLGVGTVSRLIEHSFVFHDKRALKLKITCKVAS